MRTPKRNVWMAPSENYHFCFTMKAEGEEAEVMVYIQIVSTKWWEKSPLVSTKEFDQALKDAKEKGAKKLNIRVNSPVGEVYAAVAMRSMVINNKFDSVRVMIEGLCASAATLFATIPNAHVVIAEGSEFMIHNPMTICWGNAAEMEEVADHLHKMEEQFHAMYAERTGKTEDQIKEWMDKTTWFSPKEAIENGFCDELLSTEKVAACASVEDLVMLKNMYPNVPDTIIVNEEASAVGTEAKTTKEIISEIIEEISNGTPVDHAGEPSEIKFKEENPMELANLTMDQLREGNPALFDQIQQDAVIAERTRIADIEELTTPGYEAMAAEAKANGTSAIDFHKAVVKAMKEKGASFLQARRDETAPAKDVVGGDPIMDDAQNVAEKEDAAAKILAKYAEEYKGSADGGMF